MPENFIMSLNFTDSTIGELLVEEHSMSFLYKAGSHAMSPCFIVKLAL